MIKAFANHPSDGGDISFSEITRFKTIAKRQLKPVKQIFELCEVIAFTVSQSERAAKIYATMCKTERTMDTPDTMIAACALEKNIQPITNNTRHFEHFPELDFTTWVK